MADDLESGCLCTLQGMAVQTHQKVAHPSDLPPLLCAYLPSYLPPTQPLSATWCPIKNTITCTSCALDVAKLMRRCNTALAQVQGKVHGRACI